MSAEPQETVRELVPEQSMLQVVSRAELDQQIATAHAYPRSLKRFRDECLSMATLNEQVADECIYALPRKEQGQTKMIEGPSARLAEIVASAWGNCRAGARVVSEGRDFVTAQGVFHDLERNVAITYEVQRRITGKYGRYSADMIGVTANAACSIALRNAVFKGVPKAFWNDIYEAARKVVAGDVKTLVNRRADALSRLQKIGATQEMVLATLGVSGIEDIGLDELATLQGLYNTVKEGEATIEEVFAPKPESQPATSRAEQAKEALRGKGADKPADGGGDHIPLYDEKSAIASIKKATTLDSLDAVWKAIANDYRNGKRDIPQTVDGAYTDKKAALEQQAQLKI